MSLIDVVSQREIVRKDCGPGPAWARPECDLTYILVDLHLLPSHFSLVPLCPSSLSRYSQLTELTMKCSIKHLSIHSPPWVDIQHDLKQFQPEN